MATLHLLNLIIHIGTGAVGIAIGLYLLFNPKGTRRHVRVGRVFVAFALGVGLSAIVGCVFFRFVPLFAVLSVLIPYVLLSGWHVIYTKVRGPNWVDAVLLAAAAVATALLVPVLLGAQLGASTSGVVVKSTLGALFFVLAYDAARWTFPRRWHAGLWRYEHIYKILSTLFGMMSAAVGNLLGGVPVAQLAPSVLGGLAVAFFFWREASRRATA